MREYTSQRQAWMTEFIDTLTRGATELAMLENHLTTYVARGYSPGTADTGFVDSDFQGADPDPVTGDGAVDDPGKAYHHLDAAFMGTLVNAVMQLSKFLKNDPTAVAGDYSTVFRQGVK